MQRPALHVTSPAPRDIWATLLESSAEALAFQTPAWLDCICEVGGYKDASRLYETSGGEYLVLPMARRGRLPTPVTTEASLPYGWGFGGLVATSMVRVEEATAVFTDLAARGVLRTSLRPNPLVKAAWAAAAPTGTVIVPRTAHVLDLEGGFDQVWAKRFRSDTRTRSRRAERAGLVVECDTSGGLVPVFYDLYLRSIDRWARRERRPLPLARWRIRRRDSLRKYQVVFERLGVKCRIYVTWLGGRPVAAIIVLLQGANASYWRGAMDEELVGTTGANYLLHSRAIEDACRAGCRYYHMGDTGSSASLAQFKTRFGADAHHYVEYRLEHFPITGLADQTRGLARRFLRRLLAS